MGGCKQRLFSTSGAAENYLKGIEEGKGKTTSIIFSTV